MKKRILWNDLKNNRLLSFSTLGFMAVSAFLFALTCLLFAGLLGSIDTLMEQARTPDFLQMHAGEIDEERLERFARENGDVLAYQTVRFLNLENIGIILNGQSLKDSTQDNGVSVQSAAFDYLVDMENRVIKAGRGEIYVPVCYRREYGLNAGDPATIAGEPFTIAGFLRDAQMNSMMASSKRFLVSGEDYERLREKGSEEYLIEFLLKDGVDSNRFATAYADAGLPANGPAITRSLIKMINALSDGMMALVILLISVIMVLISMLCIRFTLLARITSDRREIGMLKAVGIDKRDIRAIYFWKYIVLSVAGAVLGLAAAGVVKRPLQTGMQELYGTAENGLLSVAAAVGGTVLTEAVLLLSVWRTLKKTERMSAVEALTGEDSVDTGKRSYFLVVFVIAAGVFLMAVPRNLYRTISSESFVTYMGIGDGEIRLDIRQTDDILEKTKRVQELLAADGQAEKSVSLLTRTYRIRLSDGSETNLNVEQGDHTLFPVAYQSGRAPQAVGEIALSYLCAGEFGVQTGDTVGILIEDRMCDFTVCGVYSDITNGGKTAKTVLTDDSAPVMWSVFYVSLRDGEPRNQWMARLGETLNGEGINAKITDIREFLLSTYGATMRQIREASVIAMFCSVAVQILVIYLFTRLMMARDRNDISLRKALGFTCGELRRFYEKRYLEAACAGILIGILSGNILGEGLAGAMLKSLGAAGFRFVVDRGSVYLAVPALVILTVLFAVQAGLREIGKIRAFECCQGKE